MNRREWLKMGGAGVASAGLGLVPTAALAQSACGECPPLSAPAPAARFFELEIGDRSVMMVDGVDINMLAFRRADKDEAWRVPGPVLRVTENAVVRIKLTNRRLETHGFEVTGIPGSRTEVDPGCTCEVAFLAPQAGTYLYHDPFGDSPLYRLLGLHGVFIVEPLNGTTQATDINPNGSRTPYSLDRLDARQHRAITRLFDALGNTERFLGGASGKWVPAGPDDEYAFQEKVWVLSEVDPRFNALIEPGQPIASAPSLTSAITDTFLPRYFTLQSRSGFDLHKGDDVVPANYIGEPTLMRMVNVGLAHHSMHIHGHVMRLAQANIDRTSEGYGRVEVSSNIFEVDTWAMWPMDRRDVLLPYEIPPDIPYKTVDGSQRVPQFERMVNGETQEPFPLRYVMHDHVEMGTTAAGGNYPQGMVTHWEILGGLGGRQQDTGTLASIAPLEAQQPAQVAPSSGTRQRRSR